MNQASAIKILAIDYDSGYLNMLREFFEMRQYHFLSRENFSDRNVVKKEKVQVLLMGSNVFKRSNRESAEEFLRENQNIKKILLLDLWNDWATLAIDKTGIDAFFDKPSLSLKSLDRTVRNFFNNKACDKYGNAIKILVVDDEADICEFIKVFFEERHLEVYMAHNGDDALRMIKEYNPHIVLLDIKMPNMNGMLVLEKSRKISSDVEVIMVTGVDDEMFKKKAVASGASEYILKPVVLNELERIVFEKVRNFG